MKPLPRPGKPAHVHVSTGVCRLRHCGWSGFHVHWRHRRYRSFSDLSPAETESLELDWAVLHSTSSGWSADG